MAEMLNADLNVIQNSDIVIQIDPLTKDMNIIQALDDEPNDVGGLTAQQLKAKFDEAGNAIKTFINESLIPQVLSEGITEAQRQANETQRQSNETARQTAETGRNTAETARAAAETARQTAETARQSAETTRQTAETARQSAESTRETNETARKSNETARQSAETTRAAAETERGTAEAARLTAETARQNAEAARVAAEAQRAAAETTRQAAETARQTAETARADAFTAAQYQRDSAFNASQEQRADAFTAAQFQRALDFTASQQRQEAAFDEAQENQEERFQDAEDARNFWEAYNPEKAYVPGNKVYYNGSSYVNKAACTGVLPTEISNWQIIARQGIDTGGIGLSSIDITSPPVKTAYRPGQTFDPAGMSVLATYSNDATAPVTGYDYAPSTPLTLEDTSVTVQYTEQGITAQKTQPITVENQPVPLPTQSNALTYNGSAQSPTWSGYDSSKMTLGGITSGTNAGTYTATFTPKLGYCWPDETTSAKPIPWSIARAAVEPPTVTGTKTYNGASQTVTLSGYDSSKMTLGGTQTATDAGTYTVTVTPNSNYCWPDGTTAAKALQWTINKLSVAIPSANATSFIFTGSPQGPSFTYDSAHVTIGGDSTAKIDVGSYAATFTLKSASNMQWTDGTTAVKSIAWTIALGTVAVPTVSGTKTYNGTEQTVTLSGYDSAKMTLGGTQAATNAGTYTVTVTPNSNYCWTDGTSDTKSLAWSIARAGTAVPTVSGTKTYNGTEQTVTLSGYDSAKMTLGGTQAATNAGTYTVTVTPTSNYCWTDGTTAAKSLQWTINKAAGSLTLGKTSVSLSASKLTDTVTVTRPGDGAVTAVSSNTSVATVSVSNPTGSSPVVTVSQVNQTSGTATITVSVAAGTNYTAPANQTVAVEAQFYPALIDCTPAQVQAAASAGIAPSLWSVGDKIGIALNGTVGTMFLHGTYYAFILGFNHNANVEGNNSIHFQFGKMSSGEDIAFVDRYDSTGTGLCMNTTNTNSWGWKDSYMRGTICQAFLLALPTAWKNVIVACTKYSDNTGRSTDSAGNVTATSDKIWLLSEFEVFGTRKYANRAEQNYQAQYAYYANGNSKVKYQHSSTGSALDWWLRSVRAPSATSFCIVYDSGSASYAYADYSRGFAPGFKVA